MGDFQVKNMGRKELSLAIDAAYEHGWHPGRNIEDCFLQVDPDGYIGGYIDGELAGFLSAVAYDDHFGFIGMYLVREAFRGQGYGIQLWNEAMRHLSGRNVGLDSVADKIETYKKVGFLSAYRNLRFSGRGDIAASGASIDLHELPCSMLLDYDRGKFPADRGRLLACWINIPGSFARGILRDGKLAGYGIVRPCQTQYKISPLIADDRDAAEQLYSDLINCIPDMEFYLDVPEVNTEGVMMAKSLGMQPVFETTRMYNRGKPDVDMSKTFGVLSFEMG